VYNGKYSSEKKCQSTENGLKLEVQRENVKEDIYNIQGRLRNVTKRINQNSAISEHNKELIWKFCEHCKLQGLSTLRVLFYLNRFLDIAKLAKKDFDQMTRDDIQQLVLSVRELRKRNGEPVSERTVQDHLTAIKTFWKWIKGVDNEFPSEVKWIKTSLHGTNSQLPENLPNPEDIAKLIAAATNTRDKALISVLYDSGCRIGELLTLRIKNVAFDNYGGVLLVAGKTGQRRVRIIHSVQRLRTWLDEHPLREQPEAMVFCSLSNRQRGGRLNYEAISHMFRKLRKRSGVTKRLNPHSFRHARATLLAHVTLQWFISRYLTLLSIRYYFQQNFTFTAQHLEANLTTYPQTKRGCLDAKIGPSFDRKVRGITGAHIQENNERFNTHDCGLNSTFLPGRSRSPPIR
jgi:site-specific recombinase XerD